MAVNNVYQQYQQNSIMTASPEDLTLMLYNGAIKFINLGKLFIEEKNMEKAHYNIIRAQDIINELNITLDMNYEISKNLRNLYTFVLDKLLDANISKDVKHLDEALEIVEGLRDTWKDAMQEIKKTRHMAK